MNTPVSTLPTPARQLSLSAGIQIISAMLIAFIVLYGVGFVEMDIAHNSAHDARHSAVFPCH